jgi:hypothetical protein
MVMDGRIDNTNQERIPSMTDGDCPVHHLNNGSQDINFAHHVTKIY